MPPYTITNRDRSLHPYLKAIRISLAPGGRTKAFMEIQLRPLKFGATRNSPRQLEQTKHPLTRRRAIFAPTQLAQ